MKKLVLFCITLSLTACSDDDFMRNDLDGNTRDRGEQIAEEPPTGLKLKSFGGLYYSMYYYNSNGFVDSIYSSDSWLGYESTKKYIYNSQNQIIEQRISSFHRDYPEYGTSESTVYKYNAKNQIIESLTYDKNNVAVGFKLYSYNNEGYLIDAGKTIVNGNVVQNGSKKYQFDSYPNPHYNIYPKAYRILNFVNKNNVLVTENYYGNEVHINIHTLKYNDQNYVISEQISNMPLDSNDNIGYTYY